MAIDLCSDNLKSTNVSPRISFSHDFSQADVISVEKYIESNSSSTDDFDFCVFRRSFDQESSLADDIYLDGKILPVEIKKKMAAPPKRVAEPPLSPPHPLPQYDHKINSTSNKKSIGNSEEKKKQVILAVQSQQFFELWRQWWWLWTELMLFATSIPE
ncbi:Hypothetical predicted protein [Olea europaea subsp. europaea]|uniref:Uncharacterized protein n=1 Tax=Olea europaea subsp. europaea TaxID=158383 RepID=A0A8S0U9M3_OLEEU|nr:Hypothetical predicted protein [Olea europaea subsp. europaea]